MLIAGAIGHRLRAHRHIREFVLMMLAILKLAIVQQVSGLSFLTQQLALLTV
jgi:hypothetical protein